MNYIVLTQCFSLDVLNMGGILCRAIQDILKTPADTPSSAGCTALLRSVIYE